MYKSTIKALITATSTDQTRPAINAIRAEYGTDTVTLTATDGHMLMRAVGTVDRESAPPQPPADETVLISRESANSAVKMCPGTKSKHGNNADRIILMNNSLSACDGTSRVRNEFVDGTFPNTARIWPDIKDVTTSIAFDARLLRRLCDAATAQEKLRPMVTLHIFRPDNAAVFQLNEGQGQETKIDGVIMPMRR